MSKKISLHIDELKKLTQLCEQLEVARVEVIYKDGGGIGYNLYGKFPIVNHKGVCGDLTVEVTGIDNW